MKLIIKLLLILILGLVALGVAGYFLIPPAANKAVDEGSRYAFGVPAEIGKVGASVGLGTSKVGFNSYVLSSPTGFTDPLLSIGQFSVGVGTKSIIGDTKEVGLLLLEDVNLNLIQDGTQNNLLPVLRHLQGLGGADEAEAPTGPREGSAGPKLSIGKIRVENVGATIKLAGIPGVEAFEKTFVIPTYEKDWSDITGKEGKTVAEIGALVVNDLKEQALTAADGVVPAPVLDIMRKAVDGGLDGGIGAGIDAAKGALKDMTQEEIDAAKAKADGMVDDAKGKANDALKGAEKKAGDMLKGAESAVDDAKKKAGAGAKKALKGLLGDG